MLTWSAVSNPRSGPESSGKTTSTFRFLLGGWEFFGQLSSQALTVSCSMVDGQMFLGGMVDAQY